MDVRNNLLRLRNNLIGLELPWSCRYVADSFVYNILSFLFHCIFLSLSLFAFFLPNNFSFVCACLCFSISPGDSLSFSFLYLCLCPCKLAGLSVLPSLFLSLAFSLNLLLPVCLSLLIALFLYLSFFLF